MIKLVGEVYTGMAIAFGLQVQNISMDKINAWRLGITVCLWQSLKPIENLNRREKIKHNWRLRFSTETPETNWEIYYK